MTEIRNILSDINHRPFDLPRGCWTYYQKWNNALFLHWEVPLLLLRKYVPKSLQIDTFNGVAYVTLVAFTMQKIRPKYLPAIKYISNFHEINIRTYIENNNRKGVYFFSIEAEKTLSAFLAKKLSGLPYEKSNIQRVNKIYKSTNTPKNYYLDTEFEIKGLLPQKTDLDKWLTERYCLYLDKKGAIYRYDIHHKEWVIKSAEMKYLKLNYKIGELNLSNKPNLIHYSDGVKVIAWKGTTI